MVRVRESGRGINPNSKIGRRTVLGWQFRIGERWFVVGQCSCGQIEAVDVRQLWRGKANSCRCSRKPPQSTRVRIRKSWQSIKPRARIGRRLILGWQFSRGRDVHGKTCWAVVVRCACGVIDIADVAELQRGRAESCGCLIGDSKTKHGFNQRSGRHRLYSIWCGMRTRCNTEGPLYSAYNGRGIRVCADWNHSEGFPAFLQWAIKNGWRDGLSIDRIDNDRNYEPENCRWVEPERQAANRRSNRLLTAFGETKCIADWFRDRRCVLAKLNTLYGRIKAGIPHEEAITKPPSSSRGNS